MITAIIMYLLSVLWNSYNTELGSLVITAEEKDKFFCGGLLIATILSGALAAYSKEDWKLYEDENVLTPCFFTIASFVTTLITMVIMDAFKATNKQILIAFSIIAIITVISIAILFVAYVVKRKYNMYSLFSKFVYGEIVGIAYCIGGILTIFVTIIKVTGFIFLGGLALMLWFTGDSWDFFD